jgi:DNA-binding response OmpR family regulator
MLFGQKPRFTRLLIVEDEPLVAFDTEHSLCEEGYGVVATVDRVADAVAVIADGASVDLVLVDVNLADGSGVEVARAARARDIPVIFVTGACPIEAETLAVGCLAKPYGQRDLVRAIRAVELAVEGKPPKRLPPGFRLFAAG